MRTTGWEPLNGCWFSDQRWLRSESPSSTKREVDGKRNQKKRKRFRCGKSNFKLSANVFTAIPISWRFQIWKTQWEGTMFQWGTRILVRPVKSGGRTFNDVMHLLRFRVSTPCKVYVFNALSSYKQMTNKSLSLLI